MSDPACGRTFISASTINYTRPPDPPLAEADVAWAKTLLSEHQAMLT